MISSGHGTDVKVIRKTVEQTDLVKEVVKQLEKRK